MFKEKGKKKADEPVITLGKNPPPPGQAGAPSVEVTKRWQVGDYAISLSKGVIRISNSGAYASVYDNIHIPQGYAAAIADALLQAS